MSHSAYPTDSEIEAFVLSCGITLPTGFSFTGYGAAASNTWEQLTGWIPFLKGGASARKFNPPGSTPPNKGWVNPQFGGARILNLYAGIPSEADLVSVVCTGTVQVLNTNFYLTPANNPSIQKPFSRIEFVVPYFGVQNSTVVTAYWGYATLIPEDAWQAILRIGANLAATDLLEQILLSPDTIKIGAATVIQDVSKVAMNSVPWSAYANKAVTRYKFVNLGLLP